MSKGTINLPREDWDYNVQFETELDVRSLSIASIELDSTLDLIEHSRNDEVQFYKLVNYAKQLRTALYKIEWELKNRLADEHWRHNKANES